MLILPLLAAAPQNSDAELSPDLRAILADRQSLSDATLVAKIQALER